MEISRAYLNQLIIKCRKRYGWFPAKYAARFEPAKEKETIQQLIIKDRRKRDPVLDKKQKAKERLAKEERAKAKAERSKEKAKKAKENAERLRLKNEKSDAKESKA